MSTATPDLSTLARSKLHLSVGGKDSCSLHRWVLLKNSIVRSTTPSPSTSTVSLESCQVNHVNTTDETEDEELGCEESDAFLFPDAYKLNSDGQPNVSEAAWLDSLLETLGDEDEYDDRDRGSDVHVSVIPVDDEDDSYSPIMSPMSSSDDLINQQFHYYPSPIAVPYPVPYPPYHPPLIRSFELDSLTSSLDASLTPYRDPLPYYDLDDVEDLAVPEAIDDTSDDDESDVVSTPSLIRSSTDLALVDPASIPLPVERRFPQLHIYLEPEDSHFYPYEHDPLPFPDDRLPTYNHVYQEC